MNMFKSNGGFTLVELIVVIAILAILAGIAVPAYSGYINKAHEAADLQVLSAVNTAVQGLWTAMGDEVSTIKVEGGKIFVDDTEVAAGHEVYDLVGDISGVSGTWSGGSWTVGGNTGSDLEEADPADPADPANP